MGGVPRPRGNAQSDRPAAPPPDAGLPPPPGKKRKRDLSSYPPPSPYYAPKHPKEPELDQLPNCPADKSVRSENFFKLPVKENGVLKEWCPFIVVGNTGNVYISKDSTDCSNSSS